MGEVISIEEYRASKLKKEVELLSEKLSRMIEDIDIDMTSKPYYMPSEEMIDQYSLDFSSISYDHNSHPVKTLAEVTDILTSTMLSLDTMGHRKWADQLGDILGDMFNVQQ